MTLSQIHGSYLCKSWREVDLEKDIAFLGALSLRHSERGIEALRLDLERFDFYADAIRERSRALTGVRLAFHSNSPRIEFELNALKGENLPEAWCFDLCLDGELHERRKVPRRDSRLRFDHLPGGEHLFELYLDIPGYCAVKSLRIADGTNIRPHVAPRPHWLVYGSSITQGNASAGPSESWPVIVANEFGLNLTCLGYGGNCHMEPVVVHTLRDQPADFISLCLGINVYNVASLSERTFRDAVIGTILTLREKHANTPMLVVSPIHSRFREVTTNPVGLNLVHMRSQIREVVDLFRSKGDEHLHYQDGLELFGEEFSMHLPDGLHPNAHGYRLLAERYARIAMPKLGF